MPHTRRKLRARRSKRSFPSLMQMKGKVQVRASVKGGGGERLFLQSYTGKPMDLDGFAYPVIVDIQGARFDKTSTPILNDHEVSRRIGHTTDQVIVAAGETKTIGNKKVIGPMIAAVGVRSSDSGIAKGIVKDLKNDYPFQVSIGARIVKGKFIESGDSVTVNGRTWKGPLIHAQRTRIREVSITVLGADSETSAQIAAKAKLNKEKLMTFEAFCRSLGANPKKLTAKQESRLRAQYKNRGKTPPKEDPSPRRKKVQAKETKTSTKTVRAKQRKVVGDDGADLNDHIGDTNRRSANNLRRLGAIQAAADLFPGDRRLKIGKKTFTIAEVQAKAIEEGWSAAKFELTCRRAEYSAPTEGPGIHSKDSKIQSEVLECAIMRAAQTIPMSETNRVTGTKFGIEHTFSQKVLEASDNKRYLSIGSSIDALLDVQIRAAGMYPTSRDSSELMVQAHQAYHTIKASGFSTLNLLYIFENVMNKSSYAGFASAEGVWRQICGRRPLNDFKPHTLYRLQYGGGAGNASFRKVAADGELKHISMVDSKYSISADTYGAMISIDRKTQINDDMGMVVEQARGLGVLGAQRIEESVFVLLLSNPSSFFASGNNNLISGGGTALSIASLHTARQKFRDQVVNGKPVTVSPAWLLVPTTLETTANKIYKQDRLAATGDTDDRVFTDNEFVGQYRPIVSPYLNNTGIVDQDGNAISGQSTTQWYLSAPASAPQGSALVIGFLNGRETPYFDQADSQFNVPGGIQFRSYLDWGVAMHVTQMMLKSAGA